MPWFTTEEHVLGWITHPRWGWVPAGPYQLVSTPARIPRGPMGDDRVWVIRRRSGNGWQYALIFENAYRTIVRGAGGKVMLTEGDPIFDAAAVMSVAVWSSRKKVVEELATY